MGATAHILYCLLCSKGCDCPSVLFASLLQSWCFCVFAVVGTSLVLRLSRSRHITHVLVATFYGEKGCSGCGN
jgi:hypothetical protein